mmetsp:Transcript_5723/g.12045  ORF Transcript_5723/g.12045 Transcript_5723/m.12045 type:complete len:225 (+) Transcript_5723:172-846(+)
MSLVSGELQHHSDHHHHKLCVVREGMQTEYGASMRPLSNIERISIKALVSSPSDQNMLSQIPQQPLTELRVQSSAAGRSSDSRGEEEKELGRNDKVDVDTQGSGSSRGIHKHRRSRKFWSPEEDALLTRLIETHGPSNWKALAQHLPGRAADQLRTRWACYLSKNVPQRSFDRAEDEFILRAQAQFGNRWAHIARLMRDRSDNTVKNRFRVLMRRAAAKAGQRD